MSKKHVVKIEAFISDDGRLRLRSGDRRLANRFGNWVYTVPNESDTAVYVIGDFETPEGERVAVHVHSMTTADELEEWSKSEGFCRSSEMATGTDLPFNVIAVRVPKLKSRSVPSATEVIISDAFELRYGGGTIQTRKSGGGDEF